MALQRGIPTAFLTNEARSADLVVIRRTQEKMDQFHFIDPAEAMMRMGSPTLLVPDHVATLNADRVLVGWKDTHEARIAVRDALPFLSRASQVTVVEICPSLCICFCTFTPTRYRRPIWYRWATQAS